MSRAPLLRDGTFRLAGVAPGDYEIRVADPLETILQKQSVTVPGPVDGITLKVGDPASVRPSAGTVTRSRLLRKVPREAQKEFERGGKAALKGLTEESIQHLRNALALYPEYTEARNDLGVRYLQQGDFEAAAGEFQEAVKLDPGDPAPVSNLALAWLALRRYSAADFAVRRALALDANFSSALRVLSLVRARVVVLPNEPKPAELRAALGAR